MSGKLSDIGPNVCQTNKSGFGVSVCPQFKDHIECSPRLFKHVSQVGTNRTTCTSLSLYLCLVVIKKSDLYKQIIVRSRMSVIDNSFMGGGYI